MVLFKLAGIYDLTAAYVRGSAFGLAASAGQLGAAYFIPILYVPLLMLTHLCASYLLIRNARDAASSAAVRRTPAAG